MYVENIINSNNNKVANQFCIFNDNTVTFQSYGAVIAVVDKTAKTVSLGKCWDYSTTTGTYRNIFFSKYAYLVDLASKSGIEKALKEGKCGEYTVKLDSSL